MNVATCVLLNLASSTKGLFSISTLTRDDLDGILAADVLVKYINGKIFGPILTSHWVHGGLDKDGGHIQLFDDV